MCISIANDIDGMGDNVQARMESYRQSFGPYYGASRAVCTELGCCEANSDCKGEPDGEAKEDWSTCEGSPAKGAM